MIFKTHFNTVENFVTFTNEDVVVETPYPLDTASVLARYVKGEPIECASNTPRVALTDTFFNGWKTRDKLLMTEKVKETKEFIKKANEDYQNEVAKQKKFVENTDKQINLAAQTEK